VVAVRATGERGNTAARRLDEHAGFTELCRYHYRTGGAPASPGDDSVQDLID
jgi:hypothetical protein